MSSVKWNAPKPTSGTCLCGNPATEKNCGAYRCERCKRIESRHNDGCKAAIVGTRDRVARLHDVLRGDEV